MSLRVRSLPLLLATLLLHAAVPDARATITPEAKKVVDRYLAAVGGWAAMEAEKSTYMKGTISAFGLSGTIEQWGLTPDKVASSVVLGPVTAKEGIDGDNAWRIDQNGRFAKRDGKDLEQAKASTYFEHGLWLAPDQGGGSVALKGTEKEGALTYTVLTVTPPVGREREMWFDKTGLIDREVSHNDQNTAINRFSDYRKVAGRLRPMHSQVEIVGMAANSMTIVTDSIVVNPPGLDASRFAPPAQVAATDLKWLKGQGPAHLPFRYGERHVWLKASINGAPAEDFIFDTGASITVIDSAYAAKHGLQTEGQLQGQGAGAAGNVTLSKLGSLRVEGPDGDGVEISDVRVAVLSLNATLQPFLWRDVAGILGYDFITRFVTEIDYDTGTLVLNDPKTFTYSGAGKPLPMTLAGSVPVVKMKIDGQYEGEFRLDVGSGSTVDLHGPYVKANGLREKAGKTVDATGGGFGGTFTSTITRMKKIELGPYSWNDPIVVLSGAQVGGLASQDYAGNIGNQILYRFKCTLDYEHRVVYLEPGRRYAEPDRISRAGVQLARFGDTVRAGEVLRGSAAEAAGLKRGDEVVSLDGKPILSYTPDAISDLFERGAVGEKHAFEVQRDGKKKKVTVALKDML